MFKYSSALINLTGEVVVSHDDDLLRVTGRKLEISKLDFDELPPLSTSLGVTFASPGNHLYHT